MRLAFAGTPEFAVASLRALLASRHEVVVALTQPDRPAGRGQHLRESPVKSLAREHRIPIEQPRSLDGPEAVARLESLRPEIIAVAAYGLMIPPAVLSLPRRGCINVHASLLPRWRGAAPIQRAILAGDDETGISIMRMDEGLDTGPILATVRCAIEASDTGATLHDRLARIGAAALLECLSELEDGLLEPHPQDPEKATLAPRIRKKEGRINWRDEAPSLARRVRAFNPWSVCYTTLPATAARRAGAVGRLRIWGARALTSSIPGARTGQIESCTAQGIDVRAGAGTLRLLEVQPASGRRMTCAEYLNAHPLSPGQFLGRE